MAKKKKIYIPDGYADRMKQWIRFSQTVPVASAPLGEYDKYAYQDPGSITMEEAMTDPWKYAILDSSGEAPSDYSLFSKDHIADAFVDWKTKQNDTNIDSRRMDLLNFNREYDETQSAIDYVDAVNKINSIQQEYPEWRGDNNLQQEMTSLLDVVNSNKPIYDKVSKSISGFNELDFDHQYNKLNENLQNLTTKIDDKNNKIKEYQDANEYWQNKHKVSDWYKRKSEEVDMSFTDPDTYLYGLAGLIGSSSASWKTTLASAAVGIGATLAAPATGGASLVAAVPIVGTLNYYSAKEENKAELYQHYKDKVRQLSEADGSLLRAFEKNEARLGKTNLTDDQKLDLLLSGAIDSDDTQFNKNRLKAYEHLDDLYQDDMWAVMGDAVFDTALQLMPVGKLAKTARLGKYGKPVKQLADKTATLRDAISNKIDDIIYFGLDKTAKGLAAHTVRDYVLDIAGRSLLSMGTEMIEESNQYLNGQKYMNDQYDEDQSHFESVWDNLTQGAKSLYSFVAPWDTALSSDEEWLKNARGGALLGGLMTGAVRTLGNATSTVKQTEMDNFVSHLAMSDRLYEKDLLNKSKLYTEKALQGKSKQLLNSFDRLASMEGVDSELINQEKERAQQIMSFAQSKDVINFAEETLGIDHESKDYLNFVSLYGYYNQLYRDSKESYNEALSEYENKLREVGQRNILDEFIDFDNDGGQYFGALKSRLDAYARLEAYKQLKQQFEKHKDNAKELAKIGLSLNHADIDSFLSKINQNIDLLQDQLNDYRQEFGEDSSWNTYVEEFAKEYQKVAGHEINLARAADELKLFDKTNPKIAEIKNRLRRMDEVYKADIEFEQAIQDDHTGYSEQSIEAPVETKTETETTPDVEETPLVEPTIETEEVPVPEITTITPDTTAEEDVEQTEEPTEEITKEQAEETKPKLSPEDKVELENLRNAIRTERAKNVDTEVKTERKSQRKLAKMRKELKDAKVT